MFALKCFGVFLYFLFVKAYPWDRQTGNAICLVTGQFANRNNEALLGIIRIRDIKGKNYRDTGYLKNRMGPNCYRGCLRHPTELL